MSLYRFFLTEAVMCDILKTGISFHRGEIMNILIVEDDKVLKESLKDFLLSEGYTVYQAQGEKEAITLFDKYGADCVLLDISLSDGNGFSVCSKIRTKSDVPVIFLTASGDENSTVAGFELGADDYLAKPFRPRELAARIKNVMRRKGTEAHELKLHDISLDTLKGIVTKSGNEVFLSALEYKLLLLFLSNKGKLFSRDSLIDELWSASGEFITDNALTVYIKRLREKIEDDPKNPVIISTVRGLGYKAGE